MAGTLYLPTDDPFTDPATGRIAVLWLRFLQDVQAGLSSVPWASIDFTGSSFADILTRSASVINTGTLPLGRLSGITTTQLAAAAGITGAQLAAAAGITGSQLAAAAGITGAQLAAAAGITGTQLAAAAGITAAQLAGSIPFSKLALAANDVPWLDVDKTGSSLADLATRSAAALSSGIIPDARIPGFTSDGSSRIRQLAFDPTQSASADANTLDDYEEGTWTPTLNSFAITGATTLAGNYTKVGNRVCVECSIKAATALTSTAGTSNITGLPFTAGASAAVAITDQATVASYGCGLIQTGASTLFPTSFAAGADTVIFSATYRV